MLGMTGIRLHEPVAALDPTTCGGDRPAALPAGWDGVSMGVWLGGKSRRGTM